MTAEIRLLGSPTGLTPARLVELMQSMGPPFVKLGQYLATRPDLVRDDYRQSLLRLTDHAPAFDWLIARKIIEDDLGKPISSLFERIDPTPVAAASLAQVHRARTHDGAIVAVKVQRPDAEESCQRAFKRERLLKRVLAMADAGSIVPPEEVIGELRRWITIELDMRIELSNLERMYDLASREAVQRLPRPYPALSGRRVITADFLSGTPISEVLQLMRSGRPNTSVADLGFDADRLAENLIESILAQIYRFKFFHADPHPGNLIALPGDVIGFVDLAFTDSLTPTYQRITSDYLTAIYNDDIDGMARSMLEVLVPGDRADIEGFRRDLIEETGRWMSDRDRKTADGAPGSNLRQYMVGVVELARKSDLRMPTGLLSMYRALLTAETISEQLGSNADLASVGKAFFKRYRWDQATASFDANRLMSVGLDVLSLVKEGPGQLHRLLSDISNDKLVLSVRTSESPVDARDANNRVKLLSLSGVTITVSVLVVGIGSRTIANIPLAYGLGAILVFLFLWMIVLWRRMS